MMTFVTKNILPIGISAIALIFVAIAMGVSNHSPQADCEFYLSHTTYAQYGPKVRAKMCANMLADKPEDAKEFRAEREYWEFMHQ